MKLKDIINYIHVAQPYEVQLTSPCGYVYSIQEYQDNKDKFMNRVVYDITFRNDKVKISLFPLKEENNE